jgi:uncharacterized protein
MNTTFKMNCTAFAGNRLIASGDLRPVAHKAREEENCAGPSPVLIFDDLTGKVIEVDLLGTAEELRRRIADIEHSASQPQEPAPAAGTARGPGRPKLGVVAREVTLLPRHWDWLATQPGGASVALRKLVEEARRTHQGKDRLRQAQEAAYRFLSTMAGDQPGFEEAARALFAGNRERFAEMVAAWPMDVANHAKKMAGRAFECSEEEVEAAGRK